MVVVLTRDNTQMKREIGRYLRELEEEGITRRYWLQTKSTLRMFREHCKARGVTSSKAVDPDCIRSFLVRYEGLSYSHQRTTGSILRVFLAVHGNRCMNRMRLRFRGYGRTRVDWLTPEETEQVFRTPMTPREMLLIGAGLLQGMRRIETLRMSVRDAKEALETKNLRVRGKGRTERAIPLHEDFCVILQGFMACSDHEDDSATVLGIQRTASEEVLRGFCSRFGRKITYHTLRRTFGRNLWLLGVKLETVSELLGHSSTDMTRLYLGLNLSDMKSALSVYRPGAQPRSAQHQEGDVLAAEALY